MEAASPGGARRGPLPPQPSTSARPLPSGSLLVMRTIRDWIFTIPFLIAFGLTLGFYDIVGRLALRRGPRAFERSMASLQKSLVGTIRICGTQITIEKSDLIEPDRGYAIISNHQSMFDIAIIGGTLYTNYPKYVAKKELGKWIPSISLNLTRGGNALIDRKDRSQSLRAIREMAATAQERDVSVMIFPEGSRSRDGELREFKRGGTSMMIKEADQLPVIPVVIDGSWRLLVNNLFPVPYGTKVRVRFGDPIARSEGDADEVAQEAEAWIRKTLDEWRPSE